MSESLIGLTQESGRLAVLVEEEVLHSLGKVFLEGL